MKKIYLILFVLITGFAVSAQHIKGAIKEVLIYGPGNLFESRKIDASFDIDPEKNGITINLTQPFHFTIIKQSETNIKHKGKTTETQTTKYTVTDEDGKKRKIVLLLFMHSENGVSGSLIVPSYNKASSKSYVFTLL